jgi:predicted amidohydrolase
MCTQNPAAAIGAEDRLGSLPVECQADITVLRIEEGDCTVYEVLGASLKVSKAVMPASPTKRGKVFAAEWGSSTLGMGTRSRPERCHDLQALLLGNLCTSPVKSS